MALNPDKENSGTFDVTGMGAASGAPFSTTGSPITGNVFVANQGAFLPVNEYVAVAGALVPKVSRTADGENWS